MPLKTMLSPVIYDIAVFFSFGEMWGRVSLKSCNKLTSVLTVVHIAITIYKTDVNDDLGSSFGG